MAIINFTTRTAPKSTNASGGGSYISVTGDSSNAINAKYADLAGWAQYAGQLADTHTIFGLPYNGTQDVNGDASIWGTLEVGGYTQLHDYLQVDKGLNVNVDASIGRHLYVGKDASFNGNVQVRDKLTTKDLTVTGQLNVFEMVIDQIKSVGGAIMLTPADGFKIDWFEINDNEDGYYLYWLAEDGEKEIANQWVPGDFALCKDFNNPYNPAYYWTKVVGAGTDIYTQTGSGSVDEHLGSPERRKYNYIEIIESGPADECDGIVMPAIGQNIVQCGFDDRELNDRDKRPERQSAIYISAYEGMDTLAPPFYAHYRLINRVDQGLQPFRASYFDRDSAEFVGTFKVQDGGQIKDVSAFIGEKITNLQSGVPYIDETTKRWMIWDNETRTYKDSSVLAEGKDGSRGKDGSNGINGKDAIEWTAEWTDTAGQPTTNIFTTGDDGKVPSSEVKTLKVYGTRNGSRVPMKDASTYINGSGLPAHNVSIGNFTLDTTDNSFTCEIDIDRNSYQKVDAVSGERYIAPSSGSAYFMVSDGTSQHILQEDVFVNISAYFHKFAVDVSSFRSEYEEFKTSADGDITNLKSEINQKADEINLRVVQKALNDASAKIRATGIDIQNGTIEMQADNFTLKNTDEQLVLSADAKGNLQVAGDITANSLKLGPGTLITGSYQLPSLAEGECMMYNLHNNYIGRAGQQYWLTCGATDKIHTYGSDHWLTSLDVTMVDLMIFGYGEKVGNKSETHWYVQNRTSPTLMGTFTVSVINGTATATWVNTPFGRGFSVSRTAKGRYYIQDYFGLDLFERQQHLFYTFTSKRGGNRTLQVGINGYDSNGVYVVQTFNGSDLEDGDFMVKIEYI